MVVEVPHVLGQHSLGWRRLKISIRSSSSRRTVPIQRSAIAFARGARTGVRRMRIASLANTASNMPVNLLRAAEEPMGGRPIPLLRHQHIDDLPILVNRPVHIPPAPGDHYLCLVHEPAISWDMAARPGRVDQQRSEPL